MGLSYQLAGFRDPAVENWPPARARTRMASQMFATRRFIDRIIGRLLGRIIADRLAGRVKRAGRSAIARLHASIAKLRGNDAQDNPPPAMPLAARLIAVRPPNTPVLERPYDLLLLGAVFGLIGLGTVEIYSATAAESLTRWGDGTHYLARQLGYAAVGGLALWLGSRMDYRSLRGYSYPLLGVAVTLLAIALATHPRNGAKRWIPLGPLTFQPVEIAKLALVSYMACSLARKAAHVKTFTIGFVPHLVVCGVMMVLLLMQPDLGSSVVLGATTLGMLFMAGTRVSYIALAVLGAAPITYHLVVGTPWRLQRFLAYFNPEAFSDREGYQFLQARLAIGSGGLTGNGLGAGHQTLGYMPEAHNDFIVAAIGEELGWIGIALVIALFMVVVWRGIRAALGARDVFGGYLAFGITLLFGVQALFNLGVVLGVVPNKGITLPLVSYGGSSLVVGMFLVGLLLNVGRRPQRQEQREAKQGSVRKRRVRVRVVPA